METPMLELCIDMMSHGCPHVPIQGDCVTRARAELADLRAATQERIAEALELLTKPKPIDWPAEARKAAIAYMGSIAANPQSAGKLVEWAAESCEAAEALVYEMKRREAFGGGG